jgi:hypothetical protein
MPFNPQALISVVLSLHFVIFGWRISREISLGDQQRRTWLLVGDYLILISMLAMLAFCIITPIITKTFSTISEVCLAVSSVLAIFYPVILAGHYRLFSSKGRSIYAAQDRDVAYVTDQEWLILFLALVAALATGYFVAG